MEIYLIDNKSIGAPNLADAMRKKGGRLRQDRQILMEEEGLLH